MPSVWVRSGWNYTLRAEPTLSESELILDPAKVRTAWGSQLWATELSGGGGAVRAGGRFLARNWALGPFAFPGTCGHLLACSSIVHLFIHSER